MSLFLKAEKLFIRSNWLKHTTTRWCFHTPKIDNWQLTRSTTCSMSVEMKQLLLSLDRKALRKETKTMLHSVRFQLLSWQNEIETVVRLFTIGYITHLFYTFRLVSYSIFNVCILHKYDKSIQTQRIYTNYMDIHVYIFFYSCKTNVAWMIWKKESVSESGIFRLVLRRQANSSVRFCL